MTLPTRLLLPFGPCSAHLLADMSSLTFWVYIFLNSRRLNYWDSIAGCNRAHWPKIQPKLLHGPILTQPKWAELGLIFQAHLVHGQIGSPKTNQYFAI